MSQAIRVDNSSLYTVAIPSISPKGKMGRKEVQEISKECEQKVKELRKESRKEWAKTAGYMMLATCAIAGLIFVACKIAEILAFALATFLVAVIPAPLAVVITVGVVFAATYPVIDLGTTCIVHKLFEKISHHMGKADQLRDRADDLLILEKFKTPKS